MAPPAQLKDFVTGVEFLAAVPAEQNGGPAGGERSAFQECPQRSDAYAGADHDDPIPAAGRGAEEPVGALNCSLGARP